MIKIWLLISMISMPGMPSVKHTAELWFDEAKCEARRVDIENVFIYWRQNKELILYILKRGV
jgi:hypothetical protein